MARLWSCGFELQSVTAGVEFSSAGLATGAINTTTKRSGAASLRLNPSSQFDWFGHVFKESPSTSAAIARIAVRFATLPTSGNPEIIGFWSAGSALRRAYIRLNTSNNKLQLYSSMSGTQVGSDSDAITTGVWYILEIWATGDSTNATLKARLDGTEFASSSTETSGTFDACYIGAAAAAATYDMYIDDWAINDTTGSSQNGYPGDGYIVHLKPNAAGDNNAWAKSSGSAGDSSNYQDVDETTPDDATTYLKRTSGRPIDDYNVEDSSTAGIGSSDTITLVQVGVRVAASSSIASIHRQLTYRIKGQSGGTVIEQIDNNCNTTIYRTHWNTIPRNYRLTAYVNPQTSTAWTPSTLDSMQIGIQPDTSSTVEVRVSTMWALVEYVPSTGVSVSQSDSITLTETVTIRIPTLVPSVSDSTTVTDAPTVRLRSHVSVSDETTVTDTPTVFIPTLTLSVSDGTTVTDAPTAQTVNLISVSDSTTVTDLPYYLDDVIQISESVTVTVVNAVATLEVSVSDSTTVTDTPTLSLISYVSVSDETTVTDTPTVLLEYLVISVSDEATVTDAPTTSLTSYITTSDETTVTDSPTVNLRSYVSVADETTLTDTPVASLDSYVSVSDETTVTDTSTLLLVSPSDVVVSDTITVTDQPTILIPELFISVADEATASEQVSVNLAVNVSVSDSLTVSEQVDLSLTSNVSVTDQTTVTDTPEVFIPTLYLAVSDETTLTDTPTLSLVSYVSVSDEATITDSPTLDLTVGQLDATTSDTVTVNEAVSLYITTLSLSVSDEITATDEVAIQKNVQEVSVYDIISLTEAVEIHICGFATQTKSTTSWSNTSKSSTSWSNQSKNSTTFNNQSKNSTSFSNQSKNSSDWTLQDKSC